VKEQILEMYIHNLIARAPRVIEQHLQVMGFLHVSRLGGLNWTPQFSALWWKDGDSRHTHSIFYEVATTTRRLERSGVTQFGISCVGNIELRDVSGDTTTKN
ncbi:hypothetical protein J1N35_035542, partial [Gossypium stocksii]